MTITSFIYENNNNNNLTIPSLIISLFFKENIIINNTYNNNIELIYIYRFLNDKFINKLKNNKSILNNDICLFEQLLNNKNKNINLEKLNIKDMFSLISSIFKLDEISILRKNIITKKISAKIKYKFIELNLMNNSINIHDINSMIHSWITMNDDLYINYINNIPSIIPLYINRYNKNNIYNDSDVIIQTNINIFDFYKSDEFNTYIWTFYSSICYCLNKKQYYTIINYDNDWYLFNDNNVPCFNKIFMNDNMIVNKIKKESIFVFYKLVE